MKDLIDYYVGDDRPDYCEATLLRYIQHYPTLGRYAFLEIFEKAIRGTPIKWDKEDSIFERACRICCGKVVERAVIESHPSIFEAINPVLQFEDVETGSDLRAKKNQSLEFEVKALPRMLNDDWLYHLKDTKANHYLIYRYGDPSFKVIEASLIYASKPKTKVKIWNNNKTARQFTWAEIQKLQGHKMLMTSKLCYDSDEIHPVILEQNRHEK